MTRAIPLTRGLFAIVDDLDADWLMQWKWRAAPGPCGVFYVARSPLKGETGRSTIYMHRAIMNAGPGEEVDHRDHDGLNNCRANLRKCTRTQNQINVRTRGGASGFRGVEHRKATDDYRAAVTIRRRKHYAGTFTSAVDAAIAYDQLARELHGEFAVLNFPSAA